MPSIFSPRRIIHNPGLKLLALSLALLLWFHVATDREYEVDVPFEFSYLNLPDSLTFAEAPPAKIDARMRGTGKLLLPTLWQVLRWPIDLSSTRKAGVVTIPLAPADVPLSGIEGVKALDLLGPDDLILVVDRIGEKMVPVVSNCAFEADLAHVCVGTEEWTPDSVYLTGPKTVLTGINSVFTRRIRLTNLSEPVDQDVELMPPPVYGVTLSPKRVQLHRMVEAYVQREFANRTVQVTMPDTPDTFGVVPEVVSVQVGGPESAMDRIAPESVSVGYVASVKDTTGARRRVWTHIPAPLRVLKITPDSVTVWRDGRSRTRARN
jgi:hypothetical protein